MARFDTADFGDRPGGPGNLRVDYVLPSSNLTVCGSGVFWPPASDPLRRLAEDDAAKGSDHRLVWVDVALDDECP
jgi:3-phytase/alkaline phosphatase D